MKGVHCALLSFQKEKSHLDSGHFSQTVNTILQGWPLNRGSVAHNYLPWNLCNSEHECIQGCVAFALKSFYVLTHATFYQINNNDLLKKMIRNPYFELYFWDYLELNLDDILFVKKDIKSNVVIILCLSVTQFSAREATNTALEKFELFIHFLIKNNNALIVFSQQPLASEKTPLLKTTYSFENLKNNLRKHIAIEEIFEPSIFFDTKVSTKNLSSFSNGTFDRLLELLVMGQDFIFSIDRSFQEKIKC